LHEREREVEQLSKKLSFQMQLGREQEDEIHRLQEERDALHRRLEAMNHQSQTILDTIKVRPEGLEAVRTPLMNTLIRVFFSTRRRAVHWRRIPTTRTRCMCGSWRRRCRGCATRWGR
jgi:hypothetical protein